MILRKYFDTDSLWRGYVGMSYGPVLIALREWWGLTVLQSALAGLPTLLRVENL